MTQPRWNAVWRVVAITVAVVIVLSGMAMVAAAVLLVVAFNSWGSNK